MTVCTKCGASTAREIERCLQVARADCAFELLRREPASHPFFGAASLILGLGTAVAISAVLFVSTPTSTGVEALAQALALVAIYTFVYAVSGTFVGLGSFLLLHRQLELRERESGRLVQIGSLLGRTLSYQIADVEAPLDLRTPTPSHEAPASVAALLRVVAEAEPEGRSDSLTRRTEKLNQTANRLVRDCLEMALVSLLASGAVRVRPARVRVVWPFASRSPVEDMTVHSLEPGSGDWVEPKGALEGMLLETIRSWPESGPGDHPFATARDLVRTFKDSEGDFSHRRVVSLVEDDGIEHGWLDKRPRLSVKHLLPQPTALGTDVGPGSMSAWTRVLDDLRARQPDVLREMHQEVDAVLNSSGGTPPRALDRAQRRLRKTVALRVIGASAVMATVIYLLAIL